MKFITIIPAYNEDKTIEMVVRSSLQYSDVLVVDDGSTDKTADLAKQTGALVIKHDQNKGKGAAIKTGLNKALKDGYKTMVLIDGDGQHDPRFIPPLVDNMGDGSMVICSRFMNGPATGMKLQRRISNKLTTSLLRLITGYRITDSQCGFRAISADSVPIFLSIPYDDYEFESEMLYQASQNNLSIREIPIPCSYKGEKSYITWVKVLKYIFFIFKLLLRDLKWRIKH